VGGSPLDSATASVTFFATTFLTFALIPVNTNKIGIKMKPTFVIFDDPTQVSNTLLGPF